MVVSTHKGRTTVSTFLLTVHNMQKQHEFPLVPPSFPGLTGKDVYYHTIIKLDPHLAGPMLLCSIFPIFILYFQNPGHILGVGVISLSVCHLCLTHSSQSCTFLKAGIFQVHSPLKLPEMSFTGWASSSDALM